MATTTTIHSHQYQHFEDLQMSSREFYAMLRKMVAEYEYPDVECTLLNIKEGGTFSSKREYMAISRERYHYFVCASPFGRSFFISWWFQEDAHTAANIAEKLGTIGKAIAQSMETKTFYEVDTEMMFASSISSLIKRAVERIKADKGIRKDATETES